MLEPGKPNCMYHAESTQEDFFVVSGECVAIVEEEERSLRQFDFLHCPPGRAISSSALGDGPCVLLMLGNRIEQRGRSSTPVGVAHGGRGGRGGDRLAAEAYAPFGHWQTGGPKPELYEV